MPFVQEFFKMRYKKEVSKEWIYNKKNQVFDQLLFWLCSDRLSLAGQTDGRETEDLNVTSVCTVQHS